MKIYRKEFGSAPPDDDMYYIEAKNGRFLYKNNPVMTTILPVKELPGLEYQAEQVDVRYPKIRPTDTLNIAAFFYRAFCKFGGEAIVLIYFSKSQGYLFAAPEQRVSIGELEYSPRGKFKDYLLVGSIHSHGSFMAYHSDGPTASDQKDEANFDGLHITFGNINSRVLSISCSIMVNGQRFYLDPLDHLSGLKEELVPNPCYQAEPDSKAPEAEINPYWAPMTGFDHWFKIGYDKIADEAAPSFRERFRRWYASFFQLLADCRRGYQKTLPPTPGVKYLRHPMDLRRPLFFSLEIPGGLGLDNLACPPGWMEKVSKLPLYERMDNYFFGGDTCRLPETSK